MQPNPDCTDTQCKQLQQFYIANPDSIRRKQIKKKVLEKVVSENEWGITMDEEVAESEPAQQVKQVASNSMSLADLMNSMKTLQEK